MKNIIILAILAALAMVLIIVPSWMGTFHPDIIWFSFLLGAACVAGCVACAIMALRKSA